MRTILLAILLSTCALTGQITDKGDITFTVGAGASLNYYGTESDPDIRAWGLRTPLTAEYAFGPKAGLCVDFVYTCLFPQPNSALSARASFDAGLGMCFYFTGKKERLEHAGAVSVHYSGLRYETYIAHGIAVYFTNSLRFYFSGNQRMAIGLYLNGSGYRYEKVRGLALSPGINFVYKL